MDIDEFLDRELSELDNVTDKTIGDKTEKSNESIESQKQEQLEPSELFENIKDNLSKGNIDSAEQSYNQLWHILLEQKLNWDKEIYEGLLIVSKQFSTALNYAYNDVKKKIDNIYELISQAKASLKEGRKDMPFKLYSKISEISNSLPNVFFEEKKIVQDQIMDFYKELRSATDNELMKRAHSLIQEINQLIEKINFSIKSNDISGAIASYNKSIELYTKIPEGFLRYKGTVSITLLEVYKSLSIHTQILNLQKHLG